MPSTLGLTGALAVLTICVAACGASQVARSPNATPSGSPSAAAFRVLVFSRTLGFRHDSIPDGVAALTELGRSNGFAVEATEDAAAFTPSNLSRYRVVVFLSTTGEVLAGGQQDALRGFVRSGGGFAGIHSAADTLYDWPWYGGLVGAYFKQHPAIQSARIRVEDRAHPSTLSLPDPWTRRDEWYDFRANPRPGVHVLLNLDESSYGGGSMGADHPIAWCHEYDGGRAWYTALGHVSEAYGDPIFRGHLLGGIRYVAGAAGRC